jgi:hypothetical protein
MATTKQSIEIALRPGAPVPTGQVRVAGEVDRAFSGWLSLLSELDAATKLVAARLDGEEHGAD